VTVPALRVPVVDTTGCGDVFHGAYAACLASGGDVPTAVRFATVAASLKTRQPGGRAGIPTRPEVENHLALLI
jgi:sulfofructose kinase